MLRVGSPVRNALVAIANWRAIIAFLMVLQFDQKFKGTRLGALAAVAEPFLLIAITIAMRGMFRGRLPEYGDSIALFYSSGIFPFYIFVRLSNRARGVQYEAVRRLPRVSSTDYVIASAATETTLILSTMAVWFFGMWLYGIEGAWPASIVECLVPLFLLVVLGIGVGLVNSAISRQFVFWSYIYARVSRGLLFLSGAFYVVDLLPYSLRSVLVWNPLVHGIDWFRLGLYGRYPVHTLDREYLIGWAAGALFLGVVLHRATLRWEKR